MTKKTSAMFWLLFIFIFSFSFTFTLGQIDSQWRGPDRDGIYPNEKLMEKWPEAGPHLLWSAEDLGEGYSSAAVTSDRIYITGLVKNEGFLFALDEDGKLLWKSSYGPEWNGSRPGARTTPTVVGDKIYLISARCSVSCFKENGEKVWTKDLKQEFKARNLEWGMTESPLIDGDRIFCTPGGSKVMFAALNRHTGKTLWTVQGKGETSGYCSPCLIEHNKKRLLVTMTGNAVVGIDANTGELLWRQSHVTSYDVNANTPLYHDGYIFTNSGYGTGGQMFQLSEDGTSIKRVWSQKSLDSQMGATVLVDGYIYGSGHNNRGWQCLDWKTGQVQFKARKIGNKGSIIFSDGKLYCYSESGYVALVYPNSKEFEVKSSFRIKMGSGEHWAHPVINDGRLFIRHGDVLMVYNIAD